jgi:hypothetical protein
MRRRNQSDCAYFVDSCKKKKKKSEPDVHHERKTRRRRSNNLFSSRFTSGVFYRIWAAMTEYSLQTQQFLSVSYNRALRAFEQ